jgi:hypothetical protein
MAPLWKNHEKKVDGGLKYQDRRQGWLVKFFCVSGQLSNYDENKAAIYIQQGRLSPFYDGAECTSEACSMIDECIETKSDGSSAAKENWMAIKFRKMKPYEAEIDTSIRQIMCRNRKKVKWKPDGLSKPFLEFWVASKIIECPICCLFFPMNTNRTVCCNQPLCSSCFVQLRLHPRVRHVKCPYCNHDKLKIFYLAPSLLVFDKDFISRFMISPVAHSQITCEGVNLASGERSMQIDTLTRSVVFY